jgi:hypothetical protein
MARPTGLWLLPSKLAAQLGFWSAWDQRRCQHPPDQNRKISGDERMYGFRAQCMACGQLWR